MPEPRAYLLDIPPRLEQQRSAGVAKSVESHPSEPNTLRGRIENAAANGLRKQLGSDPRREKVFYKSRMDCRVAKTYARRLYRTDGKNRPDGFKCESGSGWETSGNCRHRRNTNRALAGSLGTDTRVRSGSALAAAFLARADEE